MLTHAATASALWPPCGADHPLNLRLITRLLQLQDFDVTAVADGGAALDALRANYESPRTPTAAPLDLAVLDTNMPARTLPSCTHACMRNTTYSYADAAV